MTGIVKVVGAVKDRGEVVVVGLESVSLAFCRRSCDNRRCRGNRRSCNARAEVVRFVGYRKSGTAVGSSDLKLHFLLL